MTTQAFRPLKTKAPAQPAASTSTSLAPLPTSASTSTAAQHQGQKQTTDQRQITFSQSLSVVKTLMSVSFGCIAYLRGLLPEENFTDNSTTHTLSADLRVPLSQGNDGKKAEKGALKVKTIKRNYSPEGDKLMDYLEKGVMDAIEKKYLRALVMSIYMNPDDPANVIETYTFSFSYPTLPDGTSIPILNVTSNGEDVAQADAPKGGALLEAAKEGAITVGAVKKAVRGMIKSVILLTQNLADLPRKRCLSFKTFYEDHTPEDYHPPMFREANLETERLYFGTRSRNQAPEVSSIAKVDTTFHGVQLTIRSVIDLLPAASEAGDGLPYGQLPAGKTAAELEEAMRKDDEALAHDELARKYLWNAEEDVWKAREDEMDADGSPDPDLPSSQVPPSPPVYGAAFAVRKSLDEFEPIPKTARKAALKDNARGADDEPAPTAAVVPGASSSGERELQNVTTPRGAMLDETQPIEQQHGGRSLPPPGQSSFANGNSPSARKTPRLSRADLEDDPIASFSTRAADEPSQPTPMEVDAARAIPPSQARSLSDSAHLADNQPSFTQSQLPLGWSQAPADRPGLPALAFDSAPDAADSAQSGKRSRKARPLQASYFPPEPQRRSQRGRGGGGSGPGAAGSSLWQVAEDGRLQEQERQATDAQTGDWDPCWCGDNDDELDMVGCDGPACRRFMHVWCCGARSATDFAPGEKFFCPSCRLRADPRTAGWNEEHFVECLRSFQGLALFRRALRICFDESLPATLSALAKRLHCSSPDAKGVLERLLREGFVKLIPGKKGRKSHSKKDHYVVDRSKEADAAAYFDRHDTSLEDRLFDLPPPSRSGADAFMSTGPASQEGNRSDLSKGSSIRSDAPEDGQVTSNEPAAETEDDEISQTQSATYPYSQRPPFATPRHTAPPLADVAAAAEPPAPSSPVVHPRKRTLASAFDAEAGGAGRRSRTRVGVARSHMDLTF